MLVFSRKVGESFMIDDNIKVTITEAKGGRVRLSIEAPKDIPIKRSEHVTAKPEADPEG